MLRLYSYSIYFVVLSLPAAFIAAIVCILWAGEPKELLDIFIFLPVFAFWGYTIFHTKRIYYKESELHLFSLFSNKVEVVKKDQGISIEKRNIALFRDTGTYKLTYWVGNDKVKTIWFAVNGFLDNPDEIIDKINSL